MCQNLCLEHLLHVFAIISVQTNDQPDGARAAASTASDTFCSPGQHEFTVGKCAICSSCSECTGYGSNCISTTQMHRTSQG